MKRKPAPFFIVGSVRSGTTLLRNLFKLHPQYVCPEETHVYRWAWPFGTRQYNANYLESDLFAKHQAMDGVSREQVAAMLVASQNRGEFLARYIQAHQEAVDGTSKSWFEKTPQNVYGLPLIAEEIPEARFVSIIRNPLNVVASLKKGVIMREDSIVGALNYWRESVILFKQFERLYPERCIKLFYEDLTRNPLDCLNSICSFLEIKSPFNRENVTHVTPEKNQYVEILSFDEQDLIRAACRPLIEELGRHDYLGMVADVSSDPINSPGKVTRGVCLTPSIEEEVSEDLGLTLKPGDTHYRAYVGPPEDYDLISAMTFNLMTTMGLRQQHRLLDIGCGSLRLGRLFIPYLNKGNYVGIEPNRWLVESGIEKEIGQDMVDIKRPEFHIADDLDGLSADELFDYVVAQSIFSHSSPSLLFRWLSEISSHLKADGAILATFVPGDTDSALEDWTYPSIVTLKSETIMEAAEAAGLKLQWLNWEHPSQQWVLLYKPLFKAHWFWGCELNWNNRLKH